MFFRVSDLGILQIFRFHGILSTDEEGNDKIKWMVNKEKINKETLMVAEGLIRHKRFNSENYYIEFNEEDNQYNVFENLLELFGKNGSYLDAIQSFWTTDDEPNSISKLISLKIKIQGGIIFRSIKKSSDISIYEGSITLEDGDIICSYINDSNGKMESKMNLEPSSIRWNVVFNKDLDIDNGIKWINTFRNEINIALLEKIVWEPTIKEKELMIWK